ncbi:MAG: S8 family serine peptidase, partial [Muribaculaceae bacterium]|nr:S8 family serine peptidase [Muribaculaceae bacterium]
MKRLLFLVIASLMIAGGMLAQDKLSAGTQMFLMMRAEQADASSSIHKAPAVKPGMTLRELPAHGGGFAPVSSIDGNDMVDAFIQINGNSTAELEAYGVIVETNFGGLVTAKIPVDRIVEVSQLDAVKQIDVSRQARLCTDIASTTSNVDKAWDATSHGLCENYTGKGVVVGVIDTGIDFQHRAFKDDNGNYRIKAVYMPNATSANGGTRATVNGSTLSGYQYTTADQIANLTYDVASQSHGTHTSTTAAGSTVKVDNTRTYTGMAPESDVVLCGLGSSLSYTAIANSARYIANYADQNKQPCVISISLGSQSGAHDGTGQLQQVYNSVAGEGKIICVASSNDGSDHIYFSGSATSTTPAGVLLDYPLYSDVTGPYTYYYNSSYYFGSMVWPRTAGSTLSFKFLVVNTSTNSVVYETSTISPTSTTGST